MGPEKGITEQSRLENINQRCSNSWAVTKENRNMIKVGLVGYKV